MIQRSHASVVLATFVAVAASLAAADQGQRESRPAPELYRLVLVQAAPGRLLDLIELYRARLPVIEAGGDERPFVVRHSQGDHWDLAVLYPSGNWPDYYSRERIARREAAGEASGVTNAEFARRFYSMIAWHEDIYLQGPPLAVFRERVGGAGLAHYEMMQALPGTREALIQERHMENAYNRERGRPETLVFVHDQGAAWDVITLDVFRDWRHFAEQETIPAGVSMAAAKKVGFDSPDAIGPYMRTLISTHRDTIGPILFGDRR
ncbi:MAG: hypothetical protein AB1806_02110 [Acidobacteriota bacterium]